jgi:putative ABC transport system permease protein
VIRLLRYIAWRRLTSDRLRAVITLLGIALGVAVVLAIELANRATTRSVESMVETIAGRARLAVRGDEGGLAEELLARVSGHPGVAAALPVIESSLRHQESGRSLFVLGVDLLADAGPRGYALDVPAPLDLVSRPDRVIVTQAYAAGQRLAIGSPMTLMTAAGPRVVRVGGLLPAGELADAFGGQLILLDVRAAQFLLGRPGRLDRIDLVPAARWNGRPTGEPAVLDALARDLAAGLPSGIRVEPPGARTAEAVQLLASFQVNLRMVSLVALFVGLFLVYNTMSIAVVQRRRETGILRALGVTRGRIVRLVTLEGFAWGVAGSALGIVLGVGLARGALLAVSSTLGRAYLPVSATEVPLSWPPMLAAALLGIGVSTVAAWLPGRDGAAMPPAITLRSLPVDDTGRRRLGLLAATSAVLLGGSWFLSRLGPVNGVALFGYLAGFGIVFGVAALAPAACLLFSRAVRRLFAGRFGVVGALAADNLGRSIGRTGLAVSALMTGLSLVVCVATMIHSFKHSIVVWVENSVRADLLVASDTGESAASNLALPASLGDSLAMVPGVRRVNSFRMIRTRVGDRNVALGSLDLAAWTADNPLVARSRRAEPPDAASAVIAENFADRFRLAAGDTLALDSPSGPLRLAVAAVILDYSSDQGAVFIDRSAYRAAWGDDLVDTFDLYLDPGASAAAVRAAIDARFGAARGLLIVENRQMRQRILSSVDNTFAIVYALEAIALAIAVLGIVNTLVASILDRRRELGLLRAVGATRRQVGRLFILEAASMGLLGIVLGLAAGLLLSWLLVHVIQFQSTGWRFLYRFPGAMVAATCAVTLVASALAGWYPARLGAKTWGAGALQYE